MSDRSVVVDRVTAEQGLVTLRARVASHAEAAFARTPAAFACRPGCDACCHRRFSVFAIEAARIRASLQALAHTEPALRARIRAQASDPRHAEHCALLVEGRCAVYRERPMICRTHGLPLGWWGGEPDGASDDAVGGGAAGSLGDHREDDAAHATLQVDVCALNFREHEIPLESVLRLDAVDAPLAVMAELWDGGQRIDLAALAAEPDAPA
jgi:hypothetical protein